MREYWLLKYISAHRRKLGLTALEGPFETGPDFRAVYKGQSVLIEAEIAYKNYLSHKHHKDWADMLIVATTDPMPEKYKDKLPPIIKNVDLQEVLKWSEPLRTKYRKKMDEERRKVIAESPSELQGIMSSFEFARPSALREFVAQDRYHKFGYPMKRLAEELALLHAYYVKNVLGTNVVRYYTVDRDSGWVSLEEDDEWAYWGRIAIAVATEFNLERSPGKNDWIDGLHKSMIKHGLNDEQLQMLQPIVSFIESIDLSNEDE